MTTTAMAPRRRPRRRGAPYLFLVPAIAFFVTFLLIPIGYAIYLSLRGIRISGIGIGVQHEKFVGLSNYKLALADHELWASLLRMAAYGLLVVPLMLALALLFALLLDSRAVRFGPFSRMAIFLPYAVPGVIATLLWGFLYLPGVSPIRATFTAVGLSAPNFFGVHSIFLSVANIAIWGGIGFNMIVMYTSLQAIPRDLYEAARIDGCSEAQVALRIKVPLLTPALVLTFVFSMIATLQVFNEPTTLKPLTNAISSTWMPLMKVYTDAFVNNDLEQAAATSVIIAFFTLIVSFGMLRFLQRRAFGEDR